MTNSYNFRLAELRKLHNVSQAELAAMLNVSRSSIAMWETGRCSPDIETLLRLAHYFDVPVDFLLGEPDFPWPYEVPPPDDVINPFDEILKLLSNENKSKALEYMELLLLKQQQGK